MDRVAVDLGPIQIYWYSIIIFIGMLVASILIFKEARKKADGIANYHCRFKWIDYKKQQEQKKIERELQEKELKHKLKEKKKIAHKLTLKTSKGQPLMKYQSQYLLEKIQKSLKQ